MMSADIDIVWVDGHQQSEEMMFYQQKNAIVSLVGTVVIFAIYSVIVMQMLPENSIYASNIHRFAGMVILVFVPVQIVSKILIQIGFIVVYRIMTEEEEPSFSDELDDLIQLKASRNGYVVFMLGFVASMIPLVAGLAPFVMFSVLFVSVMIAQVSEDISKLYFYRRGF